MKPFHVFFCKIATAVFFATATGCTEDKSLQNETFDAWCDGELCFWRTDVGKVEQVSTWHRKDYGAALVENPTIISQRIENNETKCFLFTVTADTAGDAQLYFELDYLDDDLSAPDFSTEIEASSWDRVKLDIAVPSWCDAFRVIIRKTGDGEAIVASVSDKRYEDCPLTVPDGDRPAGLTCENDEQCRDEMCSPFLKLDANVEFHACGTCVDDEQCEKNEACGLETNTDRGTVYRACGEQARHTLGERCIGDKECTTGICCEMQCAACCSDDDCPNEEACEKSDETAPRQCAPKGASAESGDFCLTDADCKSNACLPMTGTEILSVCTSDGRICTSDKDCPYSSGSSLRDIVDEYLKTKDECVTLGIFDGYCR